VFFGHAPDKFRFGGARRFIMPTLENQPGDAPGLSPGEPFGDGVGGAPYQPPRLLTGHPTLDAMLDVWHGACSPSGPPRWEDLAELIWHPWSMSLLMVESRGDGKPLHSVEAFPVATTLLGLPLFFKGALPMELPQMKELAEMARQVTETRAMIPRILPARTHADGIAVQPLVAGVPLAPVPAGFWRRPIQRVLFAVAPPVRRGVVTGSG
jgi:hypothetical protein